METLLPVYLQASPAEPPKMPKGGKDGSGENETRTVGCVVPLFSHDLQQGYGIPNV